MGLLTDALAERLAPPVYHQYESIIGEALEAATQSMGAQKRSNVGTFEQFIKRVKPSFIWHKMAHELVYVLQLVADGSIKRIIVVMPPRHGKSEIISRLFPAYLLRRYPHRWVGLISYGAEVAWPLSLEAQGHYVADSGALHPKQHSADYWRTMSNGGMWATGVGGAVYGKGTHFGIIDDPVKNDEEAASETVGNKLWRFYTTTWASRREPGAAEIVVTTRWPGPGDLVGRLLKQEKDNPDAAEHWYIMSLEALKEPAENLEKFPATVTRHPDWRTKEGEALVPERYDEKELKKIKARIGPFFWSSVMQQRPIPAEGLAFKRHWYKIVTREELPRIIKLRRYWDEGSTDKAGDYTVGTLMALCEDERYYILDVIRGQWDTEARRPIIEQTLMLDRRAFGDRGFDIEEWFQQEPGSAGKDRAYDMRKLGARIGITVHTEGITGEKEVRGRPFAGASSTGFVRLLEGDWNTEWLDEITTLWSGDHDDQGETAAGAFAKLALMRSTDVNTSAWEIIKRVA